MRQWLAVVIAISWCPLALGHNFLNGNELYEGLKAFQARTDTQVVQASRAAGYLVGVHDALNEQRTREGWCFSTPRQVTGGQLGDIVLKWLNDYPQHRHHTADSLIAAALAQAYPCGASSR